MKQTTKANLAQLQSTSSGCTSSRGGSSFTNKLVEVILDKVSRVKEVVVEREVQGSQLEQIDHL